MDISTVADRAAAEAALEADTLDLALAVPADLSSPGEVLVRQALDDQMRSLFTGAVVALRAGANILPPVVTALDPQSDA